MKLSALNNVLNYLKAVKKCLDTNYNARCFNNIKGFVSGLLILNDITRICL